MSHCDRARALFGPFWDDEVSRAEREWLDGHFASCAECRTEYEGFSRTLEAVATLPRVDAAPDLVERVLARTRQTGAAPDVVRAPAPPLALRVAPMAAAAVLVVSGLVALPRLMTSPGPAPAAVATRVDAPAEPVAVPVAAPGSAAPGREPAATPRASVDAPRVLAAAVTDSLFDHSEDVEFVLDPVLLRRGRAHKPARLAEGLQTDQAVISF